MSGIKLIVFAAVLFFLENAAAKAPSGISVPDGFDYFGSVKGEEADRHFFLSQNAAAWATSKKDCVKNFGSAGGSLANLELYPELELLNERLEGDDTGTLYWTGGKYNQAQGQFTWDNGFVVGGSYLFPWDARHPDSFFPTTRIAAMNIPGQGVVFQTHLQTESLRYFCETGL